jgi:hypothetical protein
MKLFLKSNPKEVFDAPRGIGLALIQAGVVEAYVEKVVPPDSSVKWTLIGYAEKQLWLRVDCPVCKQGITQAVPSEFRHCNRLDMPPKDLAEQLISNVKKNRPVKQAQQVERKPMLIPVGF